MANPKAQSLRQKHPRFLYQGFKIRKTGKNLQFSFSFKIEPDLSFSPQITIENINRSQINDLDPEVIRNLAFHLGLMEIPSYWKATCSPTIVIQAGFLNPNQIQWWQNLLLKGMGQFFYTNRVDFTAPDFVTFKAKKEPRFSPFEGESNPKKVLVPIGGGKDSIVALEILKKSGLGINCLALNPTPAATQVIELGGVQKTIVVRREIDPTLLKLNQQGYLNGHTPFSAYLAFLGVTCAVLFDFGQVALANERSANEENLTYLGAKINHQYSKSIAFEKTFLNYAQEYLTPQVRYFSLLRPLYELQIGRLFSQHPQYFPHFKSCNRGQKKNAWCLNCPKCLAVFTLLYPFLEEKDLMKIFNKNLFNQKSLWPTALSLIGEKGHKPFECVGTKKETLVAFYLSLKKAQETKQALPYVLAQFQKKVLPKRSNLDYLVQYILGGWNSDHLLSPNLEKLLKKEVK